MVVLVNIAYPVWVIGSEWGHYGKQSQEICWTQLKNDI